MKELFYLHRIIYVLNTSDINSLNMFIIVRKGFCVCVRKFISVVKIRKMFPIM